MIVKGFIGIYFKIGTGKGCCSFPSAAANRPEIVSGRTQTKILGRTEWSRSQYMTQTFARRAFGMFPSSTCCL